MLAVRILTSVLDSAIYPIGMFSCFLCEYVGILMSFNSKKCVYCKCKVFLDKHHKVAVHVVFIVIKLVSYLP